MGCERLEAATIIGEESGCLTARETYDLERGMTSIVPIEYQVSLSHVLKHCNMDIIDTG